MPIPQNASRGVELAEIDAYIATRGVTLCPPAYAVEVASAFPLLVERAHIAALATRVLQREDRLVIIKRLLARASRRQWSGSDNWWTGAAPVAHARRISRASGP